MLVARLCVILLFICVGLLAKVTHASCIDNNPQRIVMQSEQAPKSLRGVQEIALYADRAEPHLIALVAFDQACNQIASHGFDALYNSAAFLFIDLPAIGPSVLVEAQSFHCGSGAGLQPVLFAMRSGRLAEIAAPMLEHGNMDGYAFERATPTQLAIVIWTAIWDQGEAHYSPHRYEVTSYFWSGNEFQKATSQTTKNKYSWDEFTKSRQISPLSDSALALPASLGKPLPQSWDRRFRLRPTGLDPDCDQPD